MEYTPRYLTGTLVENRKGRGGREEKKRSAIIPAGLPLPVSLCRRCLVREKEEGGGETLHARAATACWQIAIKRKGGGRRYRQTARRANCGA